MHSTPIQKVISYLESIAPTNYQDSYDNVGLLLGNPTTKVKGILVTLDVTEEVLAEAVAKGCNLIISHHPLIFKPLKKIGQDHVSRAIVYAIQNQLALYTLHTNLDYVMGGVNTALAQRLGLHQLRFLKPLPAPSQEASTTLPRGAGMIGMLQHPLSQATFLSYLQEKLELPIFRYAPSASNTIQKVAITGGVGISLLPDALAAEVDAFVTADIKYHQFFDSDQQLLLVDIGHYESEIYTKGLLATYLSEKFNNFVTQESKVITNPIKYHV